jgi:hypothetical protein
MKQSLRKFVQNFGLLGMWVVAAFLLYSWYQTDYQIEQSLIGLPREHNYDAPYRMTDWKLVLLTIAVITAELIGLYLILRPWSYYRSIGRLWLALALFVVLMSLSSLSIVGTSDYVLFHWLWLFIICCTLAACLLVSGISMLGVKGRMPST